MSRLYVAKQQKYKCHIINVSWCRRLDLPRPCCSWHCLGGSKTGERPCLSVGQPPETLRFFLLPNTGRECRKLLRVNRLNGMTYACKKLSEVKNNEFLDETPDTRNFTVDLGELINVSAVDNKRKLFQKRAALTRSFKLTAAAATVQRRDRSCCCCCCCCPVLFTRVTAASIGR